MPIDSLPQDQAKDLLDSVADAASRSVRETYRGVVDTPGLLRDGTSGSAAQRAQVAFGRAACRRWARGKGPQGAVPDAFYGPLCQPYLEDIGEWPGNGVYAPPFTGGQCGLLYSWSIVNLDSGGCSATSPNRTSGFAQGPIRGRTSRSTGVPGRITLGVIDGNGQYVPGNKSLSAPCEATSGQLVINGVVGQGTDNCGNPPDGYDPAPRLPDDGYDGTEPWGPGLPNIRVDINPDGSIEIDLPGITGGGGGTNIPDPTDPDNYPDVPGEEPAIPGDQGEPGDSGDTGEGGEEEGEDENRILVGLKIELTSTSQASRVSFKGGEAIYHSPYAVFMGGDAALELDSESSFAREVAFYHAPENANRYKVVMTPGFRAIVTPYWKSQET